MNCFLGQGMKDDEICLHFFLEIGFVLSGNFLYFTCSNEHILISDILGENQQLVRHTHMGCYFV